MAFWSDPTGAEPKRAYRWVAVFSSELAQIAYGLKKFTKPKAKVNSIQHKYLNHFFNYPGRLEWEDINMTFASITQPDASKLINDVLLKAGYGIPKNDISQNQLMTIGKRKFNGALGTTISVRQLDAQGNVIEDWKIWNPFFTNVSFGSLDYSSEEIVDIECTLKYDFAELASVRDPDEPILPAITGPGVP